jgi:hypothetical protein
MKAGRKNINESAKHAARAGAGLYERLVGEGWRDVDAAVRRLHARGTGLCGEGSFVVRRGRGFFALALASLLRLPAQGDAVRVTLSVTFTGGGRAERWHRTFEGRAFDTSQREGAGRMLAERAGPLELLFRLSEEGGALVYTPAGAAFRVGPLRVPLPRALAPGVEARERGAGDGRSVNVRVSARAPLVGPLLSYEGRLELKADEVSAEVEED